MHFESSAHSLSRHKTDVSSHTNETGCWWSTEERPLYQLSPLLQGKKKKKNTPKPTTQARLNVKMYRAVAFQFGPGPN